MNMDEYDQKFAEMQKYIPFLEAMIERLQKVKDTSREVQLQKMQQLHGILSSSKRKLKFETLQKCEDVLKKLHSKVEKGTNAGLTLPKKNEATSIPSNASGSYANKLQDSNNSSGRNKSKKRMDETPASPSPPSSPVPGNKSSTTPIIIPTERTQYYAKKDNACSKPASPDLNETVSTKDPIIIPTERKANSNSRSGSNTPEDIIDHSVKHEQTDYKNSLQSHKRHIPTLPAPSSGPRRYSGQEKNSSSENDGKELLKIDVPKLGQTPEPFKSPKSNPTSLLISPPQALTEPPLSMEDLAELLNDGSNKSSEDTDSRHKNRTTETSEGNMKLEKVKSTSKISLVTKDDEIDNERRWEEVDKHIVKMTRKVLPSTGTKLSPNIKSESSSPSTKSNIQSNNSSNSNVNSKKSVENWNRSSTPVPKSSERNSETRYTDNYERHPRSSINDNQKIRMPDLHVIQSAFSCLSEGDIANLAKTTKLLHADERNEPYQRRKTLLDVPRPPSLLELPRSNPIQSDTHRIGPPGHSGQEQDYRCENPDFYMHNQQPMHHPSHEGGGFGNSQWGGPNPNMRGHPNGPQISPRQAYQHPGNTNHDMWGMGPNCGPVDNYPPHYMPNQFGPGMNEQNFSDDISLSPPPPPPPLIPSLMTTQSFASPQFRNFPVDRPFEPPFERPAPFLHGPPRQEQWDHPQNRPIDIPFERPNEYHGPPRHPQWEPNRPNEALPYDRPAEYPPAPPRPPQWDSVSSNRINEPNFPNSRPLLDPPWQGRSGNSNSNAEVPRRNRSNERFPNDRGRPGDSTNSRYARRSEWDIPPKNDASGRFARDPRFRSDTSTRSNSPNSTQRRDPRLSKDLSHTSKPRESVTTPPIVKPKEMQIDTRDPRRRNSDSKDSRKSGSSSNTQTKNKSVEKIKEAPKSINNSSPRRNSGDGLKSTGEKPNKDTEIMQSPLESLYGAIDTSAKTGKGYGLQKFKIPKIKRSEPVLRPPTPPKPSTKGFEDDSWNKDCVPPIIIPTLDSSILTDKSEKSPDDKKIEVSSTTEETVGPIINDIKLNSKVSEAESLNKEASTQDIESSTTDKPEESESTVDTSTSVNNIDELIESMMKTFESGAQKQLLDPAKLFQKIACNPKSYKKLQKIIKKTSLEKSSSSSGSESSSSSDDIVTEKRKVLTKKKKRALILDSSDDDESLSLADRILLCKKIQPQGEQITEDDNEKKGKSEAELIKLAEKSKENHKIEEKEEPQHDMIEEESKDEEEKSRPNRQKRKKKGKAKKSVEKIIEEPEDSKEDTEKRPSRVVKKRRNSLEMLQEDIREMFICDDVVTATGHRMCRLKKEDKKLNENAEKEVQPSPSSSPSEDETVTRSLSKSKKNIETGKEVGKSKAKGKKTVKRKTVTKDATTSSGGEENQPLAYRAELDTPEATEPIKDKSISPTLEGALEEANRVLRRSGRVSFKEPRVVIEKTELPRIEPSKTMFDTSSDESFGIDVTELTAAVDISLHSERAEDGGESIVNPTKKLRGKKTNLKRTTNANENNTTRKLNTPVTFDDEISMTSDISISSSTASSVRKTRTLTPIDTNDELLNNIVGELVNDKTNDSAHTDSDEEPVKKNSKKKRSLRQKKKRRPNQWQMGIVPKTKKKKSITTLQTPEQTSSEIIQIGNTENVNQDKTANTIVTEHESVDTRVVAEDEGNLSDKNDNSQLKEENSKIVKKIDISPIPYPKLDVGTLIEYAWTGQEKYDCLLCSFSGKNIVQHYKCSHPNNEMMISRLSLLDAERAINEFKEEAFIKLSEKVNSGPRRKFSCRFCAFKVEGVKDAAMEAFYEHCTNHTGEYRFTCNLCGYQAIAKPTMRSHYYKFCRRNSNNAPLVVIEDNIPNEQYIAGYLCGLCNFLQLKENGINEHIKNLHPSMSDVEIVKVNMSGYFDVKDSVDLVDSMDDLSLKGSDSESGEIDDTSDKEKTTDELTIKCENEKCNPEEKHDDEKDLILNDSPKVDLIEDENENNSTKKLSAFVCPPDLDNKEVEIQLERQKKMQEILNNMGTKYQKDSTNKGLSIIDKLKNKMTTLGTESETTVQEMDAGSTAVNDTVIEEHAPGTVSSTNPEECTENKISEIPADHTIPIITNVISEAPKIEPLDDVLDEPNNSTADKAEKKLKDPLTSVQDGSQKDVESEMDISDIEPTAEIIRSYDSDSSDDVSDSEMATDVHSLLKDAETINISTNAPMMTTIQRLAAQLQQGAKSIPTANAEVSGEENNEEREDTSANSNISANSIVLSSSRDYVREHTESPPVQDGVPKNFIRLRRLSGDKLSIPETTALKKAESPSEPSVAVATPAQPDKTNIEEECTFLKIENVISLAPDQPASSTREMCMINDILKTVDISPANKTVGVSIFQAGQISKVRSVNGISNLGKRLPLIAPAPTKNIIVPKISMPCGTKKNLTLVKYTPRSQTLFMSKETSQSVPRPKSKSADAFRYMLIPNKLRHLYKCMAQFCTFTTDSAEFFGQHYKEHSEKVDRNVETAPYDYETCAYCSKSLLTSDDMVQHIKLKHSFCAYQCSYCFYRAFTQPYVELHQAAVHQSMPVSVILVTKDIVAPVDNVERNAEFVIPFMCNHECDEQFYIPESFIAHLKKNHGTTSVFKCNMCPATTLTAEQLVNHYKLHSVYKYQCLYCLFGSDSALDLHHHLSSMHCNRPSKILERTLSSKAVEHQDVISQLIVKNIENSYKCSDLKIVGDILPAEVISRLNPSIKNTKQTVHVKQSTGDLMVGGKTLKVYSGSLKIVPASEVVNILDKDKFLDPPAPVDTVSNNRVENVRTTHAFQDNRLTLMAMADKAAEVSKSKPKMTDISLNQRKEKKTKTAISSTSSLKSLRPALQSEPELEFRYTNEKIKTKIDNAVDPLSIPDNLQCQDEFITINVLDNPEILKSAEQFAVNRQQDKNKKNDDDDDDSDIEILQHIQPTDDRNKRKSTQLSASALNSLKVAIDKVESGAKNNKKKQTKSNGEANSIEYLSPSPSSSNISNLDDSSSSLYLSSSEHIDIDAPEPLTLDDIKHTGFTGYDLYKCGYPGCNHSSLTALALKVHIKACSFGKEKKDFRCIHCSKQFIKIGYLVEHFKRHGLKRFACAVCKLRFALSYQATHHMRIKHKFMHNVVRPADPANPAVDGLFMVYPLKESPKKTGKKGSKVPKSVDTYLEYEKLSFSPAEIAALPRQAIYNREVQCAVCPYTTKVRTNIIRHLQLHAKDETVPESGPVNPVPCLDKKERMFDKMVNLASSSHQNGRMGGVTPKETVSASDIESVPKYIPEQKRYVCGVAECNYLTVDETMLRCHMKALHPEEIYFRCPHCPTLSLGQETQNIIIEKMGVHLKMHDTRLYKCSHCNHHHYHRHVVERHLTDKHPERRPFVKVIREMEIAENNQQPSGQEEVEEGSVDREGNYWKCNLCDYKCVYKAEMLAHTSSVHNDKSQFKCQLCMFKSNSRVNLEAHFASKHPENLELEFSLVFERIKGPKKPQETVEQPAADEPFDTTPLWRRDMPRVRHIRGILFEDDAEASKASGTKSGKRKSDGELPTKPSKLKAKMGVLDEIIVHESKAKPELADERIDTSTSTTPLTGKVRSNQAAVKSDTVEVITPTVTYGKTGKALKDLSFGAPIGNLYSCSLCFNYKSKFRQDIKDHLYRELKYWRWHCKSCGFLTVSHSHVTKHVNKQHKNQIADVVSIVRNQETETWVQEFLSRQWAMMRGVNQDHTRTSLSSISPPTITLEDSETPVIPAATLTLTDTAENTKTVDLTAKISHMKNMTTTNAGSESDEDDDDGALIIDSKDDIDDKESSPEKFKDENFGSITKPIEKTYVCKHCNAKFTRWRGYKLHVQVNHLKRLGFLCPYCDRSTNSESIMRKHIHTKHSGLPEKIINNPAAGGPELSDEFWETEYGLILPKKESKGKKRKIKEVENKLNEEADKSNSTHVCDICGFNAINFTGLKAHQRAHVNKHNLKCAHCSFTAIEKSDVWQHSEKNHPNMEWRAEEISTPGSSETQTVQQFKKSRNDEDYSKDIIEEPMPETFEPKFIHGCFYCSLRSSSLDSVRKHWMTVHKNLNETSKLQTGVPFRYREIPVTTSPHQKLVKCAYCSKKGAQTALRVHCRKRHANMPLKFIEAIDRSHDIWECKWCNESCEASARTSHHKMFHSHLPFGFKKEHDMQIMQKGYVCPECGFVSITLSRMRTHLQKHYDTFKCKRCEKNFPSIALATQHSTRDHPTLAANIEGSASNVEAMMAKVFETDFAGIVTPNNEDVSVPSNDVFRNLGVAKKSTTKQIVRPSTSVVRAVARKSTTSLSRYAPNTRFRIDNYDNNLDVHKPASVSYYGQPKDPVDLANLNTSMAVGGARIQVKWSTLVKLMNIEPIVAVKDILKDKKNSILLKKKFQGN